MCDASPQPDQPLTCPRCRQALPRPVHAAPDDLQCPGCGAYLRVRRAPEPAAAAAPTPPPATDPGGCIICRSPLRSTERQISCPQCHTVFHQDCWEYNGGCGVYGCAQVPTTATFDVLEVPAAYWGQEEKACPVCNEKILAAAVRCRHCGTTFSSARPQDENQFRQRARLASHVERVRQRSYWLLIFGLIPCTAPVAAVVGTIWYAHHRAEVQALPALHSAICKLALGVAIAQTVLTVVVALLYSALRA